MDVLRIERKAGVPRDYQPPPQLPNGKYQAVFEGGAVVVKNQEHACAIYSMGTFGSFPGQRMNFANSSCFSAKAEDISGNEQCNDAKKKWIGRIAQCTHLFLTPEEALFLSAADVLEVLSESSQSLWTLFLSVYGGITFARKYAVYRYLRNIGWVVRTGIAFGTDYLLYKDGPDFNHSSAAVRITEKLQEPFLSATIRELGNCKKSLMLADVCIPQNINLSDFHCVDRFTVKVTFDYSSVQQK
jgi:tRNA-intron lyase